MKIDFLTPPPPLKFGEGENEFSLKLRRADAVTRAAILDAIDSGSMASVQAEVEQLIAGWSNVNDENGVAIPFEGEDDKGAKTRNLSKFLGAMAISDQMRVLVRLLAFIGLPNTSTEAIITRLANAGDAGKLGGETRPTTTSDASTKTPASGK